jgi:alkylation response protein AidB-like acyl-CoA dehydrogenase
MTTITPPPATTAGTTPPTSSTPAAGAPTDWTAVAAAATGGALDQVRHLDTTGDLGTHVLERARDLGLTTALVPAAFGGGGATHEEVGAAITEIARTDPSAAVTLAMHSHLVAFQGWRHRHGQDASAFFEKVAAGAWLVSTGASDWIASNGTARRVDGGYVVSARKAPASGCELGTILVTSIRWEEAAEAPRVLHGAIPFGAEGVSIERTWDTLGLRATGSHTVVLDEVFVPDAAVSLVRPADVWHPVWNIVLGAAMPLIMAAYRGIADAAVTKALDAVAGRDDDVAVQLAGEMVTRQLVGDDAVDAMFRASADLTFDNTNASSAAVLARKTTAAEAYVDTVRLAVELVGGRAYTRGSDLERFLRDVLGSGFHPLPRAAQTRFGGRVAMGLDPVG